MKKIRYAVLGLFLCGAVGFQLFQMPSELNLSGTVSAKTDELSDTYWDVNRTDLTIVFDYDNGFTLMQKSKRGNNYTPIGSGTYSLRRNTVTFYAEGRSAKATISGKRRNIMTGKIYVRGKVYTVQATRQN